MVKKIGQGGSNATVFQMNYLGMAPMAVKISKGANMMDDPEGYDARDDEVVKESRLQGSLGKDEGILRTSDVTMRGDNPTYLMEMAKHGSLKDLYTKMKDMEVDGAKLSPDKRMLIMRYLMRGGYRSLAKVH